MRRIFWVYRNLQCSERQWGETRTQEIEKEKWAEMEVGRRKGQRRKVTNFSEEIEGRDAQGGGRSEQYREVGDREL